MESSFSFCSTLCLMRRSTVKLGQVTWWSRDYLTGIESTQSSASITSNKGSILLNRQWKVLQRVHLQTISLSWLRSWWTLNSRSLQKLSKTRMQSKILLTKSRLIEPYLTRRHTKRVLSSTRECMRRPRFSTIDQTSKTKLTLLRMSSAQHTPAIDQLNSSFCSIKKRIKKESSQTCRGIYQKTIIINILVTSAEEIKRLKKTLFRLENSFNKKWRLNNKRRQNRRWKKRRSPQKRRTVKSYPKWQRKS